MTTPIIIDLDKPYRGILYEGLLREYETRTETQHVRNECEAPALWRIVGAPDRKDIEAQWLEYIQGIAILCDGMRELADPECRTFTWRFGKEALIESIKGARASITEWVGEAPLDRWDELAGVIEAADGMLAEYGVFEPDTEPEIQSETVASEGHRGVRLPQEDIAATYRALESFLLGLNFGETIEDDLGLDEKLSASAFVSMGGRFILFGRVVRALEAREYPADAEAVALLDELIADVEKDMESPLDDLDTLLTSSRLEWLKLAKRVVADKICPVACATTTEGSR
jgi:hypothetical protein